MFIILKSFATAVPERMLIPDGANGKFKNKKSFGKKHLRLTYSFRHQEIILVISYFYDGNDLVFKNICFVLETG